MVPAPKALFGDPSFFAPATPRRSWALPLGAAVLSSAAFLTVAAVVLSGDEAVERVAEPSPPCRILIRDDLHYLADACGICECVEMTTSE